MEFDTLMSQINTSDTAFQTTAAVAGGLIIGSIGLSLVNANTYTRAAATAVVIGGVGYLAYKALTEE